MCTYVCLHLCMYLYVDLDTCVCIYMYGCVYTHICLYTHVDIDACVCMWMLYMEHMCMLSRKCAKQKAGISLSRHQVRVARAEEFEEVWSSAGSKSHAHASIWAPRPIVSKNRIQVLSRRGVTQHPSGPPRPTLAQKTGSRPPKESS